jgi:hypothetical protein
MSKRRIEMITIFSDNDEHLCDLVCEHLKVMNLIREVGKVRVIPKDESQKYGSSNKWWVAVEDECKKYSTTLEQCHNCASDFADGYKKCLSEIKSAEEKKEETKRQRKMRLELPNERSLK